MLRTIALTLPLLTLSLTFMACSSDKGDESGEIMGVPIPEAELPESGAASTCELIYSCSCTNPGHVDEPTCIEDLSADLSDAQLAAQAAGLTYDAQCAGDLEARVEAAGCVATLPLDCNTYCSAYHGDLALDMACTVPVTEQPAWSDCMSGLWCINGACQDPCGLTEDLLQLGDACRDETGSLGTCDFAAGLWCDFSSEVCIALPVIGEPCYSGEICGVGAVCDYTTGAGTCVAVPGAGEACTYACVDGYFCDGVDGGEGTCMVLPGVGESCELSNACAEGSTCNEAGLCELLPAWFCQQ